MQRYNKILVCVDNLSRDEHMLSYVNSLVKAAASSEVHILHVLESHWQTLQVPAFATSDVFLPPAPPVQGQQTEEEQEQVLAKLDKMAKEYFGDIDDCSVSSHLVSGIPLYEILQYGMDKDIDLIVIGRHFGVAAEKGDHALLARRITRKATCSVLTLPEDSIPKKPSILVPCRDSACSIRALDTACAIATDLGGSVEALNTYRVFSGYLGTSMSLKEHLNNLEEHAKLECKNLIESTDVGDISVGTCYLPDFDNNPVPIILSRQNTLAANMIAIGARGRTGAAGVLLGTVTEQLIKISPVPVLAVKKKGECIGFLRGMLEVMGIAD